MTDSAPAPMDPAQLRSQRTAWWLFAPPASVAALRWVLDWQEGREPSAAPLVPLEPFSGAQPLAAMWWSLAWPLLVLLALVGAALWARRRWGGQRVGQAALVVWALVCVAGAGALWQRHLNRQGAQALPPTQAQVLGKRQQAPNTRSTGGTQLVLQVQGLADTRQLLLDDPQAVHWQPGQQLTLQWARGRYQGLFVTGWQALPAVPAGS